ncbi:hypothetical protein P9597_01900 [Aneurinibacillus migulanus]|uniref:hypothetical protein n=1 Tax=Aneurinibacillus migulanus TaxID=47500 RepID=UPI002E21D4A3|nr:hypothetical protein [Aneurinibacillus migulanus]
MNVEGEEFEIDNMLLIVEEAIHDPNLSDYIYYSEEELSAEQVVEKALSNKSRFKM